MLTNLSRSPKRFTFQKEKYIERMEKEGKTVDNNEDVAAMVDYYDSFMTESLSREKDPEWRKNNMEYDLCSTDWILEKVRTSEAYAQNLYAAMCNNEFQKINLDNTAENVVEVLVDGAPVWSCSWRHAGGVVADMQQQGDYINWYCSGIRDSSPMTTEEYNSLTEEQRLRYEITKNYVPESVVTDEIRTDLLQLGWKVIEDDSTEI